MDMCERARWRGPRQTAGVACAFAGVWSAKTGSMLSLNTATHITQRTLPHVKQYVPAGLKRTASTAPSWPFKTLASVLGKVSFCCSLCSPAYSSGSLGNIAIVLPPILSGRKSYITRAVCVRVSVDCAMSALITGKAPQSGE